MNATAMLELSDGRLPSSIRKTCRVARYEWRLPSKSAARYPIGHRVWPRHRGETVSPPSADRERRPEDMVIHRNHDTLDNRRENLVVMSRLTAPVWLPLDAQDDRIAV